MKPRDIFLNCLRRAEVPRAAVGSATSIVTTDLMEEVGVFFPDAHLDAEKMTSLAAAGHTLLGFDNVMPLFSVWHEAAALGCQVDWGTPTSMPTCSGILCSDLDEEIPIPADFLGRPPCAVPLESLRLLRARFGDEVAVVGKVFGPWTLGYHLFGVQEFLLATLLNPDGVKRTMRSLMEVTVRFAEAQIDAGADAITLADHCTRDLCSPDNYSEFLQHLHRELHERIACPLILHICGDTSDRLSHIRETGIECFHFDSKVPSAKARELAGRTMSLMGGTGNIAIVRDGKPETIAKDIADQIKSQIDVIGPECAVPLDAPFGNLRLISEEGKRQSEAPAQG